MVLCTCICCEMTDSYEPESESDFIEIPASDVQTLNYECIGQFMRGKYIYVACSMCIACGLNKECIYDKCDACLDFMKEEYQFSRSGHHNDVLLCSECNTVKMNIICSVHEYYTHSVMNTRLYSLDRLCFFSLPTSDISK